jgi:hypothetical protein
MASATVIHGEWPAVGLGLGVGRLLTRRERPQRNTAGAPLKASPTASGALFEAASLPIGMVSVVFVMIRAQRVDHTVERPRRLRPSVQQDQRWIGRAARRSSGQTEAIHIDRDHVHSARYPLVPVPILGCIPRASSQRGRARGGSWRS